tara:strand:- start:6103 stop:6528 length:426 start_codon:yes stop_codon:yes gene_type:complete
MSKSKIKDSKKNRLEDSLQHDHYASKKFAGIVIEWRIIDFDNTIGFDRIGKLVEPAIPQVLMGVLVSDSKGRFENYRPICTSSLIGLDLQNFEVTTLNSAYKLKGPGKKIDLNDRNFHRLMKKSKAEVSALAKRYRERALH